MKQVKVFAMALVALAMVSCNNDENGPLVDTPKNDVNSLSIVIKNTPSMRADGVAVGVGDENTVEKFGAFVREYKSNNAQAANYVFRSIDYVTGKKLIFGKVIATSKVYVIANYDATVKAGAKGLEATEKNYAEAEEAAAVYTQAEVDMILEKLKKGDLNYFSTQLQADPAAPIFSTGITEGTQRYMLMTASQEVPSSPIDQDIVTGDGKGNVLLSIALDREFVKIDAGQPTATESFEAIMEKVNEGKENATEAGVTLDPAKTSYVLRRVVPTVNYFGITELQGTFVKDVSDNNTLQSTDATEYRFAYAAAATGSATNMFYATRNDTKVAPGATAIIYKVTYTNETGVEINKTTPGFEDLATAGTNNEAITIPAGAEFHRYYRAYVAMDALNTTIALREWSAVKNTFFQFTNTINGWGSADEDTALEKGETVGLNVSLTIADWAVKTIEVPME